MKRFIRKNNRLSSNLYLGNSFYFITICVNNHICVFDTLESNNTLTINDKGENGETELASTPSVVVKECLINLHKYYFNVSLHDWVIMPNHIHFILELTDTSKNLSQIIIGFKINTQKKIVEASSVSPLLKSQLQKNSFNLHKFWQKSYYDHIIRDDSDYIRIKEYIQSNPINWNKDIYYFSS